MEHKKIRAIGAAAVTAIWVILTLLLWFGPAEAVSLSERRPLAQAPELSGKTVLNGTFMADFEKYTLDQFPFRDTFRSVKSLVHYYALGQQDNNDIYLAQGHAAQQDYPLNEASLDHVLERFHRVYEKYLQDSGKIVMAVVPDKGYYLAEASGHLAMDYETLFSRMEEGMPWADHIDLTDILELKDYYRTDTHWRQENLLDVARRLCEALGVAHFEEGELVSKKVNVPFYGVYRGQTALPMDADEMYLLTNGILEECTLYDYESGKTGAIYDMAGLESDDLYDVFLSGPRSLQTIENPNAGTGRELIVYRDSFGSSLVPLLVRDYARITLVDIRYMNLEVLDRFIEFGDQDVLFLYSTLVLNNSNTIK